MDSLDDFVTWQFGVAVFFVTAAMWFTKLVVSQLSAATLDKGWFKAVLTMTNAGWGLVTALPDENFLMGASFGQRAMVGLCAGMVSHFAYDLVVKRALDKLRLNPGTPGSPGGAPLPVPKSERKTPPDLPIVRGP